MELETSHLHPSEKRTETVKFLLLIGAIVLISIMSLAMLCEDADATSSGTCGDSLTWNLDDSGNLTISGEGAMYDYKSVGPWGDDVVTVKIDSGVTSIGAKAFYGCSSLTSIDLNSVTKVGVKAFSNCTKLKSVDMGDSMKTVSAYAFYRCVRLVNVDLDDSLKTLNDLGSYSFYKCGKLAAISIPSYVNTLGKNAFSLEFADADGNALDATADSLAGYRYVNTDGRMVQQPGPTLGTEYAYGKVVYKVIATLPAELELNRLVQDVRNTTIPATKEFDGTTFDVVRIGDYAYKGYKTLRTVDMSSIETIGKQAFYGCNYLKSVDLTSAKTIGTKAFAKCSALNEVATGDQLRTVSAYAFYRCASLESIDLSDSLKSLGSYAFYKCGELEEIGLGSSLKKVGNYSFAYCASIESIAFPDTLRTIGAESFLGLEVIDGSGNAVEINANNLSGKTLTGKDGVLTVEDDSAYSVYFSTIGEKGTVSVAVIRDVPYGTSLYSYGDMFYVGSLGCSVATPASSDARYCYIFVGWQEFPDTVTGDVTVVAEFTPVTNYYSVYFTTEGESGTVSTSKIEAPYGTTVSVNGNTITVGTETCVATPAEMDATYVYEFVQWKDVPSMITCDYTIIAEFTPVANESIVIDDIPFEVTLGYDFYALSEQYPGSEFFYNVPHMEYWNTSFDFSEIIAGDREWSYGDDAIAAVTYFFPGSDDSIDGLIASDTVYYPVFEVNGMPFVNDMVCTPDLWPSESNTYPVKIEVELFTVLDDDSDDDRHFIIGSAFDYAAFEYVVKFIDMNTDEAIVDPDTGNAVPEQYGWASWAVDRNADGIYERNSFRVYSEDMDGYELRGCSYDSDNTPYTVVSIAPPTETLSGLTGYSHDELVRSMGSASLSDVFRGHGYPILYDESIYNFSDSLSPYNCETFYYDPCASIVTSNETKALSASVSATFESYASTVDTYGVSELPMRDIEFEVTLGNEYSPLTSEDISLHPQYWTASFDLSDSIFDGYYWPYGDDAMAAITFYFDDGNDWITPGKTTYRPVTLQDVEYYNGYVACIPTIEDVVCTPDLWPSADNAYPVMAEVFIYTTLFGDYKYVIGSSFDFAAFEYIVRSIDTTTENTVSEQHGWASWANDRNMDGIYVHNKMAVYAPDGYTAIDCEKSWDRYYKVATIEVPDTTPQELLGMTYDELVRSVETGDPEITDSMKEEFLEGISGYNTIVFYCQPE